MIEAFEEGYLARQRAEPTSSCEHASGSTHQRAWVRGWTEAQVVERTALDGDGEANPD
ncbi:ribosome modulation factor [Antarcticirhabdus aurantiaca]|uniref:Uncharacterized protein n=1 Tax=Antarcticirhabdus aurantiaca TaxID=2606717 RepID=A0ACD4NI85_9HYPH|nr:Rmf/CrpP family protein [Antarcticirhabdus aurantiaca]WAJ26496.1 hypothetical protein OXU80_16615 [Jeongeuplla avenae]